MSPRSQLPKYLSEHQLKALLHSAAKKLNKRDFAIHVKLFEYLRTLYIKNTKEYTSESSKKKSNYRVDKKITS
jgi:hypothetical protein